MWANETVYRGNLAKYPYPADKEVGDFLKFLKQIKSNKRIYLLDVPRWNLPLPPLDYDVYILCMFGEAVDEDYLTRIDNNQEFSNKHVILLTSQYYYNPKFSSICVFYIEHLHTVIPFLPKPEYTRLSNRQFTHGSLSHRNAVHKTILTAKLLKQFGDDLQYSFCNGKSDEYNDYNTVVQIIQSYGFNTDLSTIKFLHDNPRVIPGPQWSVDNSIYHNSRLIWTAESMFISDENKSTAYITEKTLKSIISGSCFISVGQQHTLKRLKDLGFETYEQEFGIDYDTKYDQERYQAIFNLIENYNLDTTTKHVQEIADYNHNYFYGDFYKNVEQANAGRIEQLIDYINEL